MMLLNKSRMTAWQQNMVLHLFIFSFVVSGGVCYIKCLECPSALSARVLECVSTLSAQMPECSGAWVP